MDLVKKQTRWILRTRPGMFFLNTTNKALMAVEWLLDKLTEDSHATDPHPVKTTVETLTPSEDKTPDEDESKTTDSLEEDNKNVKKVTKVQFTEPVVQQVKATQTRRGLPVYRQIIVVPLRILVKVLAAITERLFSAAGVRKSRRRIKHLSAELSVSEIDRRPKRSPLRRLPHVDNVAETLKKTLEGDDSPIATLVGKERFEDVEPSPNRPEESDRKRDKPENSSSDEEIDMENYDSDLDDDYVPPVDGSSTDSLEFSNSDESDTEKADDNDELQIPPEGYEVPDLEEESGEEYSAMAEEEEEEEEEEATADGRKSPLEFLIVKEKECPGVRHDVEE